MSAHRPRSPRAAAVALLATLLLALAQPLAGAHADLVLTSPAADTRVTQPLHAVVLELSAPPRLAWLTLWDPDGTEVPLGRPSVDDQQVTAVVGDLAAPGRYDLRYRVVAADGHTLEGDYSFVVARSAIEGAAATGLRDTQVEAPITPRGSGSPAPWLLAAAAALVAASAVARRHGSGRAT